MNWIAFLLAGTGYYLVSSGFNNRPPLRTIQAIIQDPSDLSGTIERFNGTWGEDFTASGGGAIPPGLDAGVTLGKEALAQTGAAAAAGKAVTAWNNAMKNRNGRLNDSELQRLAFAKNHKLMPAAAAKFEELNAAYKNEFGRNISITDSYRTLASQFALKAAKGNLAATPGTSNHGLGTAVDLGGGINNFGTKQYKWMLTNAPRFGWNNPDWARQGGKKPEPWHWEFTG